ncbi:Thiol-disulfide oxidoreductase YkuV [bacterium HR16]|nr:Thiol-disulfide oxidoreductase YkuV [bacterium HR16]
MPLRIGTPMPDLRGVTEWLNGEPDWESLKGHLVLVHFWSVSCHLCHENMPKVNQWRDTYAPAGLRVIAIHQPRDEWETDVETVKQKAAELGITQPCGIDNLHKVAEAYENQWVPAYYLFDRAGQLRGRTAGYAGLSMLENALKRLFETQ